MVLYPIRLSPPSPSSASGIQVLQEKAEAGILVPASAGFNWICDLLHFHRDFQVGGIAGKPFLDVETADDGGFALGLDLGEFHGVLGVFLLLELNGFGFLFHDLILIDLLAVNTRRTHDRRLWLANLSDGGFFWLPSPV